MSTASRVELPVEYLPAERAGRSAPACDAVLNGGDPGEMPTRYTVDRPSDLVKFAEFGEALLYYRADRSRQHVVKYSDVEENAGLRGRSGPYMPFFRALRTVLSCVPDRRLDDYYVAVGAHVALYFHDGEKYMGIVRGVALCSAPGRRYCGGDAGFDAAVAARLVSGQAVGGARVARAILIELGWSHDRCKEEMSADPAAASVAGSRASTARELDEKELEVVAPLMPSSLPREVGGAEPAPVVEADVPDSADVAWRNGVRPSSEARPFGRAAFDAPVVVYTDGAHIELPPGGDQAAHLRNLGASGARFVGGGESCVHKRSRCDYFCALNAGMVHVSSFFRGLRNVSATVHGLTTKDLRKACPRYSVYTKCAYPPIAAGQVLRCYAAAAAAARRAGCDADPVDVEDQCTCDAYSREPSCKTCRSSAHVVVNRGEITSAMVAKYFDDERVALMVFVLPIVNHDRDTRHYFNEESGVAEFVGKRRLASEGERAAYDAAVMVDVTTDSPVGSVPLQATRHFIRAQDGGHIVRSVIKQFGTWHAVAYAYVAAEYPVYASRPDEPSTAVVFAAQGPTIVEAPDGTQVELRATRAVLLPPELASLFSGTSVPTDASLRRFQSTVRRLGSERLDPNTVDALTQGLVLAKVEQAALDGATVNGALESEAGGLAFNPPYKRLGAATTTMEFLNALGHKLHRGITRALDHETKAMAEGRPSVVNVVGAGIAQAAASLTRAVEDACRDEAADVAAPLSRARGTVHGDDEEDDEVEDAPRRVCPPSSGVDYCGWSAGPAPAPAAAPPRAADATASAAEDVAAPAAVPDVPPAPAPEPAPAPPARVERPAAADIVYDVPRRRRRPPGVAARAAREALRAAGEAAAESDVGVGVREAIATAQAAMPVVQFAAALVAYLACCVVTALMFDGDVSSLHAIITAPYRVWLGEASLWDQIIQFLHSLPVIGWIFPATRTMRAAKGYAVFTLALTLVLFGAATVIDSYPQYTVAYVVFVAPTVEEILVNFVWAYRPMIFVYEAYPLWLAGEGKAVKHKAIVHACLWVITGVAGPVIAWIVHFCWNAAVIGQYTRTSDAGLRRYAAAPFATVNTAAADAFARAGPGARDALGSLDGDAAPKKNN